jgi:hypothetical protein
MTQDQGRSAAEWLAQAADDPAACLDTWEREQGRPALLAAGRFWDVLIAPAELGALAVRVLRRCLTAPGPVLRDAAGRVGFLVPVGTAERWLGSGLRCAGAGSWIVTPHPRCGSREGIGWLVAPDGSGGLSDPVLLELALHEASARLHGRGDPGV